MLCLFLASFEVLRLSINFVFWQVLLIVWSLCCILKKNLVCKGEHYDFKNIIKKKKKKILPSWDGF